MYSIHVTTKQSTIKHLFHTGQQRKLFAELYHDGRTEKEELWSLSPNCVGDAEGTSILQAQVKNA